MQDQTHLPGSDHERPAHQRKFAELRERLINAIRYETDECTSAVDEAGARAALNVETTGLIWEAKKRYQAIERNRQELEVLLERVVTHDDFSPDHPEAFVKRQWEQLLNSAASNTDEDPKAEEGSRLPLRLRDTWAVEACLAFLRSVGMSNTQIARELTLLRDCSEFVEAFGEALCEALADDPYDEYDDVLDVVARLVVEGKAEPSDLLGLYFVRELERIKKLLRVLLATHPM